jgi:hypothetical protein
VNAQTNGNGGLTITDQGGGNYTASYTWDPGPAQALGLYDLQFEVSDGTDNASDIYDDNLDELEVNEVVPNNPPVIAAGAPQSSANPVNRVGTASTTISTAFSDADQPGVGAFTVTLRVREPDNSTVVDLVNAQTNGNGGLTITDQGGGNYTASYSWDPGAAQALGFYDIYAEITDGSDNAIDGYANNTDEFEIIDAPPNNPPAVTAGATAVDVSPVNRFGTDITTISTSFSDADIPGVGAFNVTFRVREPDDSTVVTLVDAQTNGNGGLTVTDQGGGNYTASYTWDPDAGQAVGLYDLFFEVNDGSDTTIDGYGNNTDELEINEIIPNSPPVIVTDATTASKSPVGRTLGDGPGTGQRDRAGPGERPDRRQRRTFHHRSGRRRLRGELHLGPGRHDSAGELRHPFRGDRRRGHGHRRLRAQRRRDRGPGSSAEHRSDHRRGGDGGFTGLGSPVGSHDHDDQRPLRRRRPAGRRDLHRDHQDPGAVRRFIDHRGRRPAAGGRRPDRHGRRRRQLHGLHRLGPARGCGPGLLLAVRPGRRR